MANTITADEIREHFSHSNVGNVPAGSSAVRTLLELVADVNLAVLKIIPNCMSSWLMPMNWRD